MTRHQPDGELMTIYDAAERYRSVALEIEPRDGQRDSVPVAIRIDTPIEAAYFSAGGILPYVLEQLLAQGAPS